MENYKTLHEQFVVNVKLMLDTVVDTELSTYGYREAGSCTDELQQALRIGLEECETKYNSACKKFELDFLKKLSNKLSNINNE